MEYEEKKNVIIENAIFDIGANNGIDGISFAINNPDAHVFAFEPIPYMQSLIQLNYEKVSAMYGDLNNYTLVPLAVSDFNGTATFNVAGFGDYGCSSLNNFKYDLGLSWPEKQNISYTEEVLVKVITLESFIEEHNINNIIYIHIDAQGSDLKVIKSLGKFKNQVLRGVLETAATESQALYAESDTIQDVINYFVEIEYVIERIKHNDPHCNELNIYFSNPNYCGHNSMNININTTIRNELNRRLLGVDYDHTMLKKLLKKINYVYQLPVRLGKKYFTR